MGRTLREVTDEQAAEVERQLGVLLRGLSTLESGEIALPLDVLVSAQSLLTGAAAALSSTHVTLIALAARVDDLEHLVLDELDGRVGDLEERVGLT